MYRIREYTKRKARAMGLVVKPSTRLHKKIDVYQHGKIVASVGDIRYDDYATLVETHPEKAEERKRLYHIRHRKDEAHIGTPGYYAAKLLW